jgi:50S ribosomal subunit-associated GTPase HflX
MVFNKTDRLTHGEEDGIKNRVRGVEKTPAVFVSAHREESLVKLLDAMKARLRGGLNRLVLSVPAGDGEAMAALYREGEVVSQESKGSQVEVDVRIPDSLKGQLQQRPGIRILKES